MSTSVSNPKQGNGAGTAYINQPGCLPSLTEMSTYRRRCSHDGPYYAHTPPENDDPNKWQTMRDHTRNVADPGRRLRPPRSGPVELALWAAWLHDVGKYSDEFQKYLISCDAARSAGR